MLFESLSLILIAQGTPSIEWQRGIEQHFEFCQSVNFESALCPQMTNLFEVKPLPTGKLTSANLGLAASALRMKRDVSGWLQSLKLNEPRPANSDAQLWDTARWIQAQELFGAKKFNEANQTLDALVETFKMRSSFHQQRAWVQFFAGQYDRALGSILASESPLTDRSPFFKKYFLRALIERESCQYEKAFRTITEGRKQLQNLKPEIDSNPWTKVCVKKAKSELCAQLKDWMTRGFESERAAALTDLDVLETEMNGKGLQAAYAAAKKNLEPIVWPFLGEAWMDELGYYSVEVNSECSSN